MDDLINTLKTKLVQKIYQPEIIQFGLKYLKQLDNHVINEEVEDKYLNNLGICLRLEADLILNQNIGKKEYSLIEQEVYKLRTKTLGKLLSKRIISFIPKTRNDPHLTLEDLHEIQIHASTSGDSLRYRESMAEIDSFVHETLVYTSNAKSKYPMKHKDDAEEGEEIPEQGQVWYAIVVGRKPGLYDNWTIAQQQVTGYINASYKKFKYFKAAYNYFQRSINGI